MLDAITFDLGCARSSSFVFPDVSGLAPLTLPDELLRGQSQQQPAPQSDTVRRFETAMSAEPQLPSSVVKSVMACMIPESRKVEGPEVESPKVKSPPVEGLKVEGRKSEIATVVTSVPVASVDEPAVGIADPVVHEGSAVRSAAERPVDTSLDRPKIQVIATTSKEPIVTTEGTPTLSADKQAASMIEAPGVVSPTEHTVVPAVVENLNRRVEAEEKPVIASIIPATPITPDALVAKPVARAEPPVAVDKPISASVEPSVRVASPERPVVPAVAAQKVVTVERPEVPAVEVPKVLTIERSVVAPADNPTITAIERPVIAVADKPVISPVEHPAVAAVGIPKVATIEKPVTVVLPAEHTSAPVVVENLSSRVEAKEQPVAASSIPATPATPIVTDASVAKPVAMVETPVAAVPVEPTGIIEKTPVVPDERPIAAKVSNPTVMTVEKPEEKAVAASAHVVVAPAAVESPAPQVLQASPEVSAASAASARTEVLVETVNQIVEAVVGQILVTPGITYGECEIKIMLKPTVLDGSEVSMSAKDGTLTVSITPATQEASAAAAAALPRLEIALAEHAPAFHHVSVALQLKKGNRNEAV